MKTFSRPREQVWHTTPRAVSVKINRTLTHERETRVFPVTGASLIFTPWRTFLRRCPPTRESRSSHQVTLPHGRVSDRRGVSCSCGNAGPSSSARRYAYPAIIQWIYEYRCLSGPTTGCSEQHNVHNVQYIMYTLDSPRSKQWDIAMPLAKFVDTHV